MTILQHLINEQITSVLAYYECAKLGHDGVNIAIRDGAEVYLCNRCMCVYEEETL